jgi:hypothetical protein
VVSDPAASPRLRRRRITDLDGHRIVGMLTNTQCGQLPDLELRHRRHARVEDRIRNAKDFDASGAALAGR